MLNTQIFNAVIWVGLNHDNNIIQINTIIVFHELCNIKWLMWYGTVNFAESTDKIL